MSITRRQFTGSLIAGGLVPMAGVPQPGAITSRVAVSGPGSPFVMFSKHLAELGWADLGKAVREAGFDGVDLTVRPGGHVAPARVSEDLPRAVAAIRDAGSSVAMLTTGLTQSDDPAARATFAAARATGATAWPRRWPRWACPPRRWAGTSTSSRAGSASGSRWPAPS